MPDEPRNILVMLPNWVGDAVMFTPLLRQLRRQFPQAQMTLAGRAGPVAVLRPNPWTDKLLVAAALADLW
jgi:heptosyltransferase-2